MTDPSPPIDTGTGADRGSTGRYPGMPRWVKVAGIVVLAAATLYGLIHLTGLMPGMHGAGSHGSGTHGSGHQP